ncbi:hypothetical protein D0865_05698 [Lecanosticta acicola]|uniref:G domain-containing protein n=1 Tax=Lecanosticta acicola TaxID=111012 RepID=A0AAI9E9R1_9PEZI|nr:hypothetical protein D0865_05698 [Lecanosticta acicola]
MTSIPARCIASPSPTPPVKTESASQTTRRSSTPNKELGLFVTHDESEYGDADDDGDDGGDDDEMDSSGDDNVQDSARIKYYDESIESLPKAAAYDPDFKQVPVDTLRLVARISQTVPAGSRKHPKFEHLIDQAERLVKFPVKKKHRINVVGKSGAGKSSLLNCLLGLPGHAKALAGSKACTHVPTAYEGPFDDQTKRFAARIEFFTRDQIRKMMELMVDNYYEYHFENHDGLDTPELANMQNAAETALDTFHGLFRKKQVFATREDGKGYLSQSLQVEYGKTLVADRFASWCEGIVPNTGRNDTTVIYETESEQELRDYIQRYAFGNPKSKEPCLWPLVNIIREGMKGIEFLKYVTLFDWPGSDDTNHLRANASAQRIYDCDEIWIVSSADRIATDPAATTNLIRYGKTIPCALICTGIDDKIDGELVEEIEGYGHDIGNHDELVADESSLQNEIDTLHHKKERADNALSHGWTSNKQGKRKRLSKEARVRYQNDQREIPANINACEERQARLRQEIFELRVHVRKQYIKKLLHDKKLYQHALNGRLELMFASNTHYARHKGRTLSQDPLLPIKDTGIPEIRQYILSAAAPGELKTVQDFLNFEVEVLLKGVGLVTDTVDLKGCEEALKMVESKQQDIEPDRDYFLQSVDWFVQRELIAPLQVAQARYSEGALKVLDAKKKWPYMSLRAFIRKRGCHETRTIPHHSWTEEFIQEMVTELEDYWSALHDAENQYVKVLQDAFIGHCRSVAQTLDRHESKYRLQQHRFEELIEVQARGIEQLCAKFAEDYERALRTIHIEATQADDQCPTGYFFQAMGAAWDEAKEISGPQAKARALTIFETHLKLPGDRSPFAVLCTRMAEAIVKRTQELLTELTEGVKRILGDIRQWLEAMFYEQSNDPQEIEVRQLLEKFHIKAQEEFGEIRDTLKVVERRYQPKTEW